MTLAADGRTANFKFSPDEQEFKRMMAPDAFAPVPGGWGAQGWTTATLSAMSAAQLQDALETAWRHAVPNEEAATVTDRASWRGGAPGSLDWNNVQISQRPNMAMSRQQEQSMCRNIRTLFNFDPPATDEEIRASALQFVRKLSGFN